HSAGVPRRQAARATGSVTFTGTDGEVIVTGTRLRDDGQLYETTEEGTIASGAALVSVAAVDVGADSNRAPATELQAVSPIPGVMSTAVVDNDGLRGGADLEKYAVWR